METNKNPLRDNQKKHQEEMKVLQKELNKFKTLNTISNKVVDIDKCIENSRKIEKRIESGEILISNRVYKIKHESYNINDGEIFQYISTIYDDKYNFKYCFYKNKITGDYLLKDSSNERTLYLLYKCKKPMVKLEILIRYLEKEILGIH